MAVNVQFNKRFPPAEATRGQFVPIDSSTITGYPTGDSEGLSRGRYAQLNYIVGSEPGALNLALSGGSVILPVSTVNITEPVRVENQPGDLLDVDVAVADTVYTESVVLTANHTKVINFGSTIMTIEIYNNSANTIYYLPYSTTGATVSSDGLPIISNNYYSIDREIDTITIFNDAATTSDVRILGNYKA